jgi:Carbohydrate esterase, sialic acid-specific acetylesterase
MAFQDFSTSPRHCRSYGAANHESQHPPTMANHSHSAIRQSKAWTRCLLAGAAAAALIAPCGMQARTWTSSDGTKTFEGELKSYDPDSGSVGVTLPNGKAMSFNQSKLSEADIAFLKEQGKVTPESKPAASSSSSGTVKSKLPDVLPDHDGKEADMSKPVQVFIMMGQSNMVGMGEVGPESKNNSLEYYCKKENKYPHLIDDAGKWIVRNDVRCAMVTCDQQTGWLEPGYGAGDKIGPELGFGHVVGHAIDAPVLLIKACIGNRSLGWDLLPPGSERFEEGGKMHAGYKDPQPSWDKGAEPAAGGWYAGKQYDDDTANAKAALESLDSSYPGAKKYEVAGFVFWQGEKDGGNAVHAAHYEKNLVAFIKQLRKDFDAPNAKFVLATLGEAKKGSGGNGGMILEAHLAVDGAKGRHPEFKGNVATVYSNPLSNGGSGNGHYGNNAGTYMNVGDAMGRAMVELLAK